MRTHLIRPMLAAALFVAFVSASAIAQPLVRGKVVDSTGKPVAGATITFVAQFQNLSRDAKSDSKGEFLIVGLPSGQYEVTAAKDGVGTDKIKAPVTQGQNVPVNLTLRPEATGGGGSIVAAPTGESAAANKAAQQALQVLAKSGSDALAAGNYDGAITAYTDVVAKAPTCGDCYFNLGVAHMNKKQWAESEAAFKKAIEIKPDSDKAHTQLASVYNQQRKFDLAAEESALAAKYSASADPAGGGNAEALYNQGVTLFNGAKFAEAKTAFEGATKADPKLALAHYQLGMTALNLGDFALAVSSLETYLQLDPNGPKAAETKAALPALQKMVKK
ncbi:MAG TPA: tetratricopeptide repeat protein [Vicinamibacterales bacterium]|nr:tetratricopeptide repeat protein [Vicinamibacterales bacterium]